MSMFDGISGKIAAKVMAGKNAAAEQEAVQLLNPQPGMRILVIGFGPGIGLKFLLETFVQQVVGIDPSSVMHKAAAARNRAALESGRLQLIKGEAAELASDLGPFDGAIAVHTLQICRPFAPTAQRLAQSLRPGAPLIAITHGWAARKDYGNEQLFTETIERGLIDAGFARASHSFARAEKGSAILLMAAR